MHLGPDSMGKVPSVSVFSWDPSLYLPEFLRKPYIEEKIFQVTNTYIQRRMSVFFIFENAFNLLTLLLKI